MSALERLTAKAPARGPSQQTVELVQAIRDGGVLAATRVDAAAYVTFTALTHTQRLSDLEGMYSRTTPHAADRFTTIVDAYAATATQVILGLGGRGY